MSAYNINDLVREAQVRWLKPAEVLFILQNYENRMITNEVPQQPGNGRLFLYNKRVLRFFRRDGHSWRRKRDGRTVGEAHERLKVGNVEALNCYYAHGDPNHNFQRRSFWMLDPAFEHIVLVHYRDILEGRNNAGNTSQSPISPPTLSQSPVSYNIRNNAGNTPQSSPISPSTFSQSPVSYNTLYNAGNTPQSSPISPSTFGQSPGSYNTPQPRSSVRSSVLSRESFEQYPNLASPGSEFSSLVGTSKVLNFNNTEITEEVHSSSGLDMSEALRRLENQLSLNDNDAVDEITSLYTENLDSLNFGNSLPAHTSSAPLQGDNNEDHQQWLAPDGWKEVLEDVPQVRNVNEYNENGTLQAVWANKPESRQDDFNWYSSFNGLAQNLSALAPVSEQDLTGQAFSRGMSSHDPNLDNYASLFDQDHSGMSLQDNLGITVSQKQKFTIRDISPEWSYASEVTKVFIIGSFLCDPSESVWSCMFGGIEVPAQVIQDGVLCCHTPEHVHGKVSFYITSGNRASCSEVREFEFRNKTTASSDFTKPEPVAARTQEELLLLVRLGQLLLPIPSLRRGDSSDSGIDLLGKSKAGEDSWDQAIDALWFGTSTSSSTTDWLLEELLKDKLQNWLSSRLKRETDQETSVLSKKEQGIIHIIAGLGFEWALPLILNAGVSLNFRDIKGWTALHWAARFGREKMVATLIASGASANAVTDANQQDPTGKTPATIAAAAGHKGLAAYLSEVELTSHLSSLTLDQTVLSEGLADVEAERTLNSVVHAGPSSSDDHVTLKHSLAAVRNAAQAAARIQSAFRAHSFRRRQERGDGSSGTVDEFGIHSDDIGLVAAALHNSRDHNSAALAIQKKYRGYKGRKDYLSLRQKVVKIQAHVRGYRVRKNYPVCWAVGVLEKVILRWRRHGVGLRGFRNEMEAIDEAEEEEIRKVFRKQKVDAAVDEAVKRVLSMVESPDARNQYQRLLERYRKAKLELRSGGSSETGSSSNNQNNLDGDDDYQIA